MAGGSTPSNWGPFGGETDFWGVNSNGGSAAGGDIGKDSAIYPFLQVVRALLSERHGRHRSSGNSVDA